jgi:hypothetical protein
VWVRREREREMIDQEGKDLPFGVYLLFSSFVAIAAVRGPRKSAMACKKIHALACTSKSAVCPPTPHNAHISCRSALSLSL